MGETPINFAYMPLDFCKVNANERKESLLLISRVPLDFCKVNINKIKTQNN